MNMYPLTIKPLDLYFGYWIAHLVPLYLRNMDDVDEIYKANKWVKSMLPNLPLEQNIHLGNKIHTGANRYKRFHERFLKRHI